MPRGTRVLRPGGRHPRRRDQLGRSGAARSRRVTAGQRRRDAPAGRLVPRPRPAAGLHVDRPGLRRESRLVSRGRPPGPILAYGRTKAEAEKSVIGTPGGTVARISLLYGRSSAGRDSFFDRAVAALLAGRAAALLRGRVPDAARSSHRRACTRPARGSSRPRASSTWRGASGSAGTS